MSLFSLVITNFRNLRDAKISTEASQIFLIGENGQGKSNFLEAVYFSAYGTSFRTFKENELIRSGSTFCSVNACCIGEFQDNVAIKLDSNSNKKIKVNDKIISDRKLLIDIMSPIVFCHEDLDFILGIPERRRWFFDQSICIHDQNYLEELRKFRKILKTRNLVIKDKNISLLSVIDEQFVDSGMYLMGKRAESAVVFSNTFGPAYETVSGIDGVSVRYSSSWKGKDRKSILEELTNKRETDILMATSTSGPQRDRYSFVRTGSDFSSKASTGQRRLLALLLRSTQAKVYTEKTGKLPILLLDDVLLELDPQKRLRFLNSLPAYDQAFYTFLPEEPYHRYKSQNSIVYNVIDGELRV